MELFFDSLASAASTFGDVLGVFAYFWFLILPPLLFSVFKTLWMPYVWGKFGSKLEYVLLELIPPRDIEASPLPMESVFAGIAGAKSSSTTIDEWIKGSWQASFSLEIVSLEGQVHFYIRCQKGFRNLIEAHLYAQYPTMEIVEVPDYMQRIPETAPNKDWNVWGTDFEFVKPAAYPIRTYKYFEESVTGKMVDPLAALVEAMSKAGPGQFMLLQYIIAPEADNWHMSGRGEVDKLVGRSAPAKPGFFASWWNLIKVTFGFAAAEEKKPDAPLAIEARLTLGERDALKAMEDKLGKIMFWVKMRYVYVGRSETFNKPTGVSAIIGAIKQFNDNNLNGVKPNGDTKTEAHYFMAEQRMRYMQRQILNNFRWRNSLPYEHWLRMNIEELATVFHIPDMSIVAPTLSRVAARRGGAPGNLPVE